jgi:hypothetical protein
MNALIKRLAHEATAPVEEMLGRLLRSAALLALAAACAVAASVFLTVDLFLFLEERYGPLIAASMIAGAYLIFAAIFAVLALRKPARRDASAELSGRPGLSDPAASQSPLPGAAPGAASTPRNPELAANIDAAVLPLARVLRDAGLENECMALQAGAEVAKQLNPFTLLALALGAGVLTGRSFRATRKLF